MAVSRRLAILSIGTIILLCFLFTRTAVADADADYGDDIHTVRHSSTANCNGERPDEGDQCREDNDAVGDDDDFDDTYKIVNNIAVKLSSSGSILQKAEESDDTPASEEGIGSMFVLGH